MVLKNKVMKTMKGFALFIMLFTISLWSCHKVDQKELISEPTKTLKDCTIDPSFKWETAKSVDVRLTCGHSGVVYIIPVQGNFIYHKGFLSKGSEYHTKISVPAYIDKVKLRMNSAVHEVSIIDNKLVSSLP